MKKTGWMKAGLAVALAFAGLQVQAMATWATLNTAAHKSDVMASDARAGYYSAYFCTVETAENLFGGSSVEEISEYVKYHYSTTAAGSKAFQDPYYSDGAYTLDLYDGTVYSSSDYVALAFYGDHQFKVYGEGSAQLLNGSLIFDDQTAASGTVSGWQQASNIIPEPSSGLLLLLGGALLALRRRRTEA